MELGLAFVLASEHALLEAAVDEAERLRGRASSAVGPARLEPMLDVATPTRPRLEFGAFDRPALREGVLRFYVPTRSLMPPGLP
ncbi:MAG: hypothetical protein JNK82_33795 [Myxococcaceae bacterium]|nr:hypothetical protein [Myxococcaceae bacterium]